VNVYLYKVHHFSEDMDTVKDHLPSQYYCHWWWHLI